MAVTYPYERRIDEIERILRNTLRPVAPRPEFIRDLRRRLALPGVERAMAAERRVSHTVLLVVASVLSSALLLLNGSRVILSLLATIGVIRNLKRDARRKRLASASPPA